MEKRRGSRWINEDLFGITTKLAVFAAVALAAMACKKAETGIGVSWAKKRGWKARPIEKTTLEQRGWRKTVGGGVWRNLPFDIDAAEEADVKTCAQLARKANAKVNDEILFVREDVRDELETILEKRPDFFYAEYLLAIWHRLNGNERESDDYAERAFKHAPVVLIQPYQYETGVPLAGADIQVFAIECNRVKKGSLDPSLKLVFPALVTDAKGCLYLPTYDTVFRTDSMAHPPDHNVDYPRLGWFSTSVKVGVLPTATVTPRDGATDQ